MSEIQYVTNKKGRKRVLRIDPGKHRALWEDFIDGLISESRRNEKGIPYGEYRANRFKPSTWLSAPPRENRFKIHDF